MEGARREKKSAGRRERESRGGRETWVGRERLIKNQRVGSVVGMEERYEGRWMREKWI
jgi:hypothetical protein